jgi:hypothetical protein
VHVFQSPALFLSFAVRTPFSYLKSFADSSQEPGGKPSVFRGWLSFSILFKNTILIFKNYPNLADFKNFKII